MKKPASRSARRFTTLLAALALTALASLPLRAQVTITFTNARPAPPAYSTSAPNSPTTLTVSSGTATQSGILSGTGAVELTGFGTLILSGANTYTGGTTISAGTLALSGGSALADTAAVTLANAAGATLALSSDETIGSLASGGPAGGNVTLGSTTLTTGGDNTPPPLPALSPAHFPNPAPASSPSSAPPPSPPAR